MIAVGDEVRVRGTAARHAFFGVVNQVYTGEGGDVTHVLVRSHTSGGQYYVGVTDVKPSKRIAKRPVAKPREPRAKLAGHFEANRKRKA